MAEFGLKYYAEMRSKHHNILWRVEIAERGYAGSSEEMTFAGDEPIIITWEARGDEFYAPVKASEATINILCKDNFHYLSLFTSDARQFRVSIFRSGALYWRGFVTADLYSETFTAPPYTVTIKAVDGFNLLESYIFKDLMSIGTSGRLSLWNLTTRCLDLLELDMEVSDWLDLYGEGMNEGISPLRQTYIDLERLYYVYEEPTYRDILELCLLPFAGQIFQSSGALHIRRAISLYQSSRPVTFFEIGSEFPVGEVMTDDAGTHLIAEEGVNVVTSSGRDVVDDMWNAGIYIMGEATLDIVPALRSVTVDVKNKSIENLADHLGFFSPEEWDDPNAFIDFGEWGDSLCFCGSDAYKGTTIYTKGVEVAQCNFPIQWEFSLQTTHREWTSERYTNIAENYAVNVHYGIRVVAAGSTHYLTDSGDWSQAETCIVSEVKTGTPESIKVEINGIPADGVLQFFIRQTLIGKIEYYESNRGRYSSGHQENATFSQMTMTIDAGDNYDKGLKYESLVNPANNVEMSIALPVSDIPAIPNDHLLYALYYLDAEGNPTRLWHTKGANNYDTLVGHIVQSALKYKQLPSKRLTGDIFTAAHLDMNTVLQDTKYLHAAYSVNSIELQVLDDNYNCELTEMPRFIIKDKPAAGDDCVRVLSFDFEIQRIVRCLNFLLFHDRAGRILIFDSVSRTLREIYRSDYDFEIFAAENGFVRFERGVFYYCDHRGTVKQVFDSYSAEHYYGWATYLGGYFALLYKGKYYSREQAIDIAYLVRPEAPVQRDDSSYRRSRGYSMFYGTPLRDSVFLSGNCIVVNTTREGSFSDSRFHTFANVKFMANGNSIVSISDDFIISNADDMCWLYKRTSITEYEQVCRIGRHTYHCDHTLSEVAICYDSPFIFDIRKQELNGIMNLEGQDETIMGMFFIYGELYIVRETAIYKYVPQN